MHNSKGTALLNAQHGCDVKRNLASLETDHRLIKECDGLARLGS